MDELADPIMERNLESLDANGNAGTIQMRVGKPYQKAEAKTRGKWRCLLQITGMGINHSYNAPGIDSVESVLMSLRIAKHMLDYYSQKRNIKIIWQDEEDLGLWLYPEHEDTSSDEKVSKFDFEEIFNEFFRTYGKE